MNMQFRTGAEPGSSAASRPRLPIATSIRRANPRRTLSLSGETLARPSGDLRQASLSGHDGRPALSEGAAQCLAPRRLSAGRRPAGLVAVVHAAAASRSQQCRARRAVPAPYRAGHAQPGSQRGVGDRHQRLADRRMDQPGQPPQRLGRGRQRGRPGRGRRNPQARRRQEFRAGAVAQPQCRAARAAPLLADLRGRRGGGSADRRARLRLRRQSDHRVGLAELLHRGDGRPFAVPADRAGEHRAGRRVRAASETQDGDDRGRLRLGAVAVVAARQELAADAQRSAASQASAVGIYPRPHLLDHAADGRPRAARSSVRGDRLGRLGQTAVRDRLSALGL